MKRFLVFTLTLLFATTCLPLTHLTAESDYRGTSLFNGTVYGVTYVSTSFSYPIASTSHAVTVSNSGPGSVKFYLTGTMQVYWNGGSFLPNPKEKSDIVGANGYGSDAVSFSCNLSNKDSGAGYVHGSTDLKVRDISTNAVEWGTSAHATTFFQLL